MDFIPQFSCSAWLVAFAVMGLIVLIGAGVLSVRDNSGTTLNEKQFPIDEENYPPVRTRNQ